VIIEILTAVILAVIPLLAAWITSQAIPWIKARTTAEQRKTLMMLVRSAVRAAEQVFKGKQGDGIGAEKLEYAKAHVRADLRAEGAKIPDDYILEEYIEAAMLELAIRQEWALTETVEHTLRVEDGASSDEPGDEENQED